MIARFLQIALCMMLALVFMVPGAHIFENDTATVPAPAAQPIADEPVAEESTTRAVVGDMIETRATGEALASPDEYDLGDTITAENLANHRVNPVKMGGGTGSRAGADVRAHGWSANEDIQKGVPVNIEFQVNNTGDTATTNTVTVDLEIQNYFGRVIHTDQKVVSGSIAAAVGEVDGFKNVTFSYTPDEATYATFTWDITMNGDADTTNNQWQHNQWIRVWIDLANQGVKSADWSQTDTPWIIDDTITGDDQVNPQDPPHTYSEYHTSPDAWHPGNDNDPLDDTYDTNIDNASIISTTIDFDDLWYNTQDHTWTGSEWTWSNNKCDEIVEHAWLLFTWYGESTGPQSAPQDYFNMHAIDVASGNPMLFVGDQGGDFDGWYSFYTDCNGNQQFDPDSDVFAMNMDAFIEMGGQWQFSWDFTSDNLPDPGKIGLYFDDFFIIGVEPNPIENDCYVWKIGDVGLTEPGKAKSIDVWVRNRAVEAATDVPVKLEVDGSVVDTKQVSSISPDSDQKITMVWTPSTEGPHDIEVYSQLPDDEFPENDGETFSVYTYATPESIDDDIDVLIVDNDQGENNSGFWQDGDFFFMDAFEEYADMDIDSDSQPDATHSKFNVWLTTPGYGEAHNGPDDSVMANYEFVIWLTGFSYGREYDLIDGTQYRMDTFTADDINNIKAYLTSGGGDEARNLWVLGQGIMFDLQGLPESDEWLGGQLSLIDSDDYTTTSGTFEHDYLHVAGWTAATATADPLEPHADSSGVPDCPVTEDLVNMNTMHIPYGRFTGGSNPGTDVAVSITPYETTQGDTYLMFQGENESGSDVYNAVMYDSDLYTSYFFGFEFGCIEDVEERAQIIWNILETAGEEGLNITSDTGELLDEEAYPGDIVEMAFNLKNIGKKEDIVDIEVVLRKDDTTVSWETDWGVSNRIVDQTIPGETEALPVTINVTVPDDWEDDSVAAGTVIDVNLTMTSTNTGLKYYTEGYITILPVDGMLEMDVGDDAKVSVGKSTMYDITLRYVTNGVDDLTVDLAVTGPGKDYVELDEEEIILSPYRSSQSTTQGSVQATFTAGDYQWADDYEFTVTATATDANTDVANPNYENSTTSITTVRQDYNLDLTQPEDAINEAIVDPNAAEFVEYDGDKVAVQWFELELWNMGNGEDTFALEADNDEKWDTFILADEPRSSDDLEDYEDDTLEELTVDPAPESVKKGTRADDDEEEPYTAAEVFVVVLIPKEDFINFASGDDVEVTFEAKSENKDQKSEISTYIKILKPDINFAEYENEDERLGIWLNISLDDGSYLSEDAAFDDGIAQGTTVEFSIKIANEGDVNFTDSILVVLNITDDYDRNYLWENDTVSALDMFEFDEDGSHIAELTYEWEIPDNFEENTQVTLTFEIDPMNAIMEDDDTSSGSLPVTNAIDKEIYIVISGGGGGDGDTDGEDGDGGTSPDSKESDDGSSAGIIIAVVLIIVVVVVVLLLMVMKKKKPPVDDEFPMDDMGYAGEGAYAPGAPGGAPAPGADGAVAGRDEPAIIGDGESGGALAEDKPAGLLPPGKE